MNSVLCESARHTSLNRTLTVSVAHDSDPEAIALVTRNIAGWVDEMAWFHKNELRTLAEEILSAVDAKENS